MPFPLGCRSVGNHRGVPSERSVHPAPSARALTIYTVGLGMLTVATAWAQPGLGVLIGLAVGASFVAYGLVVARRLGVEVTDEGFLLRRPLSTHRVPWDEVDRFDLREGSPGRFFLVKQDGTAIKAWGVGRRGRLSGAGVRASRQIMDGLNELARSRASPD